MSEVEIDLGEDIGGIERGKSSDIIPRGEYLTEITGCRESEKDGAKSVVVEFTVKADTVGGKYVDSVFVEFMSLKSTALWKIAALLDAVYGQTFKGKKFPVKEVLGKRIAIYTSIEEYNGKDSTRVQKFSPAAKFSGNKGNSAAASTGTSGKEAVSV